MPRCDFFICQGAITQRLSIICINTPLVGARICAPFLSLGHPKHTHAHTHTFLLPLPLAPISLIYSSIIIIVLLINHHDSEGATLHLSTGTHCFLLLSLLFTTDPSLAHSALSLSLSLWDPHTAPHQHWRTSTAVLSPWVCFIFFISPPNWHVQQQGGARPRSNSRPLVNL